jgi:GNAT superfamily N-acetyltransferase
MTSVEPLDPTDDEQFAAYHAVYVEGHGDEWDRPYNAQEQRAELLDEAPYVDVQGVVARDESGAVVGMGYIEMPQKDNLDLGYIDVVVAPDQRRKGHGSAVLTRLADLARAAGRSALYAEVRWDLGQDGSGHTAFAEATGFRRDLVDAHRVLTLPVELPSAPPRDGYTLRSWRGRCPEEWIDQYANLLSLIVQEAPSGDYPLENEFFDAARVRSDEQLLANQGRVMQVVAAVSPDGVLAGHTQLVFSLSDLRDAYQWDTLVLPEHRGHGLGLSLKMQAMQESADLIEDRHYIHTYNAASNGPMIAVNEKLGYRQVAWLGEYVRDLSDLAEPDPVDGMIGALPQDE